MGLSEVVDNTISKPPLCFSDNVTTIKSKIPLLSHNNMTNYGNKSEDKVREKSGAKLQGSANKLIDTKKVTISNTNNKPKAKPNIYSNSKLVTDSNQHSKSNSKSNISSNPECKKDSRSTRISDTFPDKSNIHSTPDITINDYITPGMIDGTPLMSTLDSFVVDNLLTDPMRSYIPANNKYRDKNEDKERKDSGDNIQGSDENLVDIDKITISNTTDKPKTKSNVHGNSKLKISSGNLVNKVPEIKNKDRSASTNTDNKTIVTTISPKTSKNRGEKKEISTIANEKTSKKLKETRSLAKDRSQSPITDFFDKKDIGNHPTEILKLDKHCVTNLLEHPDYPEYTEENRRNLEFMEKFRKEEHTIKTNESSKSKPSSSIMVTPTIDLRDKENIKVYTATKKIPAVKLKISLMKQLDKQAITCWERNTILCIIY